VECPSNRGCDVSESWICSTGVVTAGTWYKYEIYWDLPQNVANGRVACWWDDVLGFDDNTVQTQNSGWKDTDRIYSGMVDWHWWHTGSCSVYTDELSDCGCKLIGSATPVPP